MGPASPPPAPAQPSNAFYEAPWDSTCEEQGFLPILTNAECEAAAVARGYNDQTVCGSCPVASSSYPIGCHIGPNTNGLFTVKAHNSGNTIHLPSDSYTHVCKG